MVSFKYQLNILFSCCAVVSLDLSLIMFSGLAVAAMVEMEKKRMENEVEEVVSAVETEEVIEPIEKSPNDEVYECQVCLAQFNRRYNRDRHVELIHGVPRPGGRPPLFPNKVNLAKGQDNVTSTITKDDSIVDGEEDPKTVNLAKGQDNVTSTITKDDSIVDSEEDPKTTKDNNNSVDTEVGPKVLKRKATAPLKGEPKKPKKEEDEKEEEEKKNDKIDSSMNLIQMPVGKEVVVTVFITSK